MNREDLANRGLADGDQIEICGLLGDEESHSTSGLTAVAYDIPSGSIAGYYPEMSLSHFDPQSGTPSYKGVSVPVTRAAGVPITFGGATPGDVERAASEAWAAFQLYRATDLESRAAFLETIAEEVESIGDVLIVRAMLVCRVEGWKVSERVLSSSFDCSPRKFATGASRSCVSMARIRLANRCRNQIFGCETSDLARWPYSVPPTFPSPSPSPAATRPPLSPLVAQLS